MTEASTPVGDVEAEVSTPPASRSPPIFMEGGEIAKAVPGKHRDFGERHDCAFCGHSGADRQREIDGKWIHSRCAMPGDDRDSVERQFTEVAKNEADAILAKQRRVRRAAVNRLIDMIRIEQLNLSGPNDRTDVEELIHDTIMMALDRYVEARPKATPGKMSMALDTLEKMRAAGEK